MTPSVTYRKRRRDGCLRKMSNMRAAKERKRISHAVELREMGVILFHGEMFGGVTHRIRCLSDGVAPCLWLEIDGLIHRPRTYRGVLRMLTRRLAHTST